VHAPEERGSRAGIHEAVVGAGNFAVPFAAGGAAGATGRSAAAGWAAAAVAAAAGLLAAGIAGRRGRRDGALRG